MSFTTQFCFTAFLFFFFSGREILATPCVKQFKKESGLRKSEFDEKKPVSGNSEKSDLEIYFQQINLCPLLTLEEEQSLTRACLKGDLEARDKLIRSNLRLVVTIAKPFSGRGIELEDLIAEGNIGLIRATKDFNPELGFRFSTYASGWIKHYIRRAIVNHARTIRIPNYLLGEISRYRSKFNELKGQLNRIPTETEVFDALEINTQKKRSIIMAALKILDGQKLGDEEDFAILDLISDEKAEDPSSVVVKKETINEIRKSMEDLNPVTREVLIRRFQLDSDSDVDRPTLQEIADEMGLSRARIQQIEANGIQRLSRSIKNKSR